MRRLILPLLIALLAVPAAAAGQRPEDYDYENLAFRGIGVWFFGVLPARSESTLGLHMRADLGELGPSVRIAPSVTFWSTSIRDGELARMEERIEAACERSGVPCAGIDLGQVSLSDLSLDVDAHYLWTTGFGLEPYAGVGVGLHLVNGRGEFVEGTFVEDVLDAITPGLNLMAGLELPLGLSLRLQGEVRGVLASNARWVGVGIGGSWTIPSSVQQPRPPAPEAAP
ncbi:MAG TPA: hypothetical protein VEW03_05645 [Longimicrobiaceae bacterium]|nr:hypothetical protein [Longimicrobiaceae bacterium]